jgi:hypothetical protein
MPKNQKPIIPNEPWYPAALKLIIRMAGDDDRPCFPAAPPPGSDRGCLPDAPRPRGPRRRDDRGCFP